MDIVYIVVLVRYCAPVEVTVSVSMEGTQIRHGSFILL